MPAAVFQWDENKARRNLEKHGVDFEEAKTAFVESFAALLCEKDHSSDEEGERISLFVGSTVRTFRVCETWSAERTLRLARSTESLAVIRLRGGAFSQERASPPGRRPVRVNGGGLSQDNLATSAR